MQKLSRKEVKARFPKAWDLAWDSFEKIFQLEFVLDEKGGLSAKYPESKDFWIYSFDKEIWVFCPSD